MNFHTIQRPNFIRLICFLQISLIIVYFSLNIINVGEGGVAITLLALFISVSLSGMFFRLFQKPMSIYRHFFVFVIFILWLIIRGVLDFSNLEFLKQITIATTGGIVLFFMLGTFVRETIDNIANSNTSNLLPLKTLLLIFFISILIIFSEYSSRLVRTDIFYIDDIDGSYQRPGNLLIISFIIISFSYLKMSSHKNSINLFLWISIYTVIFSLSLISSQMIGSNAATANLTAIYLITIVIAFLGVNNNLRKFFFSNTSTKFLAKIFRKVVGYAFLVIVLVLFAILIILNITDFDFTTTRAFGFGSGSNTSVNSRMEILRQTGLDQISYSPIFGNLNVASIVTGDSGKFLHNFIPNIMAELGIIGLSIFITLIVLIFKVLIQNIKQFNRDEQGFQKLILNLWLVFVLLFLLLYANISVGKEWSVMWFFLGFSVCVFSTYKR